MKVGTSIAGTTFSFSVGWMKNKSNNNHQTSSGKQVPACELPWDGVLAPIECGLYFVNSMHANPDYARVNQRLSKLLGTKGLTTILLKIPRQLAATRKRPVHTTIIGPVGWRPAANESSELKRELQLS